MSARVVVRPYRPEDRDLVWKHYLDRAAPADSNGRRRARRAFQTRFERSGTLANGLLELAIDADGRLVGDVQARQPRHALPPGVFEVGIEVFAETDRGRGYGRAAIAEMTRILFEEHDASRVQASTAVGNVAMRGVLERLGYTCEGVLRGFWRRHDGAEDYAMYGMTRADWLDAAPPSTF